MEAYSTYLDHGDTTFSATGRFEPPKVARLLPPTHGQSVPSGVPIGQKKAGSLDHGRQNTLFYLVLLGIFEYFSIEVPSHPNYVARAT